MTAMLRTAVVLALLSLAPAPALAFGGGGGDSSGGDSSGGDAAAQTPGAEELAKAEKKVKAEKYEEAIPLLEKAIKDPDPKLAETAVGLAASYGIREAVRPMLGLVDSYGFRGGASS